MGYTQQEFAGGELVDVDEELEREEEEGPEDFENADEEFVAGIEEDMHMTLLEE